MEAFSEQICPCGCRIIRSGPTTKAMYADFDYAVVGVPHEDGTMTIKALVAPKWPWWCFWRSKFSRAHVAAMTKLLASLGYKPEWERAKRVVRRD